MAGPARPEAGEEARLVVGLVRGIQGLRGALRVEILTDNQARFDVGSTLYREDSDTPLTVISAHRDGPGLLVRFAEVKDRQAADRLRDAYLEATADASLNPDSYYWHDIVGSSVTTQLGEDLGAVADVFRVGEGEVYVVRGPRGEILVPAVATVVKELAPLEKRIVVDGDALGITGSVAAGDQP
ncbi:MAG: ribosome maturation factor RimM [Candidatus Limnocylindrales bacterium]